MKRVLIITYYWPPAGGSGVQRVTKFCKYLNQFGWEPIILTVDSGEFSNTDKSLLKNIEDFATVNEIYGQYFEAPFPARATYEVARLPKDALIEIESIAKK